MLRSEPSPDILSSKTRWEAFIGGWKSANGDSRSGAIVELFYEEGYNVLMVDREHTALNTETVLEHIRAARALRMPCVVRVADGTYHELNRTLDQGPEDGIFVPRIRGREKLVKIVHTVKYPPKVISQPPAATKKDCHRAHRDHREILLTPSTSLFSPKFISKARLSPEALRYEST